MRVVGRSRLGWYTNSGELRQADCTRPSSLRVLRSIADRQYLVIDHEATAGVMLAATILTVRALAPVELSISNWKSLIGARHSLYHAKVAARDPLVAEIEKACQVASVFITKSQRGATHYKVGETQAIGGLRGGERLDYENDATSRWLAAARLDRGLQPRRQVLNDAVVEDLRDGLAHDDVAAASRR